MNINRHVFRLVAFVATIACGNSTSAQGICATAPLAVQVLGSGGPLAGDARASTSYLVWRAGRAIVLVDAGGGSFLRFGESHARLGDLSLLAISHLHPDHVADLPALLWLSETARQQPLKVAGPSGAGVFPGFDAFTSRLFDGKTGAFPILSGTLGQAGRGVRLDVIPVAAGVGTSSKIFADSVMQVTALGVPHGDVPSISYRVQVGNRAIVFGSDQNGSDARFSEFAANADVLVMHFGISERAPDDLARLHAKPTTVGQLAQEAGAKRLVLSHMMQPPPMVRTPEWFTLSDIDKSVADVRKHFTGPVDAAVDLQCFVIQ